MRCGSTVITYWKVRFSSGAAVSKACVHVSCLMIIKRMILFILSHFSSFIILLHATKVACEHSCRGGGCWQLLSISCHLSSTRSCNTFSRWSLVLNECLMPPILPLHGSPCMLQCLLPVTTLQCPDPFLSAILTSGMWCSVSVRYLYFRNKCWFLSCDHKAKYWRGKKF